MGDFMPEFATKDKPHGSSSKSDTILPPLRVRYYRQIKPQRVYTVQVSWKKPENPPRGPGKEVTVRLIAAGAQVLPSEQTLDASQPDAKAVFYLTPLAKGWLRNEKLEVLAQGRKVQELPLATKVVTQRLTWFLLFCTFFVPWFITEYIKNSPMLDKIRNAEGSIITPTVEKQVKNYLIDNLPQIPRDMKGGTIDTSVKATEDFVANAYRTIVLVCGIQPIALYVGVILLFMALISAFLHRQSRCRLTGKPITIPGAKGAEDGENEE
jgi:hypothetical protein